MPTAGEDYDIVIDDGADSPSTTQGLMVVRDQNGQLDLIEDILPPIQSPVPVIRSAMHRSHQIRRLSGRRDHGITAWVRSISAVMTLSVISKHAVSMPDLPTA